MNATILNIAVAKFQRLANRYSGFLNVGVDNWRGWRFIFDTEEVRQCNNNCSKCFLYHLLKNEKEGIFSAGLYLASKEDKKIFGAQKFLNCKTLKQYEDCFVNFIIQKLRTEEEIKDELRLVENFKIIFSKEVTDLKKREDEFQRSIYQKLLNKTTMAKKKIIEKVYKELSTRQ